MHDDFAKKLTEMMRLCGKSCAEVAKYGNLDPAYVRCLANGSKKNPSSETIVKLFIGLVFDVRIFEKDRTLQQGLKHLAVAAGLGVAVINVLGD